MTTITPNTASTTTTKTSTYTQGHTPSTLSAHNSRTAAQLCQYLIPTLTSHPPTSSPTLLDIGCGPGSISTSFTAYLPPSSRIIGIDTSPTSIATANADPKKPANVTFEVGDAFNLRWGDESFDVVHANYTLMHLNDPTAVLREMRRVCRKGGVVAVREAVMSAVVFYPCTRGLQRWKDVFIEAARGVGNYPDAGGMLVKMALEAGFGIADLRYLTECTTYSNAAGGGGKGEGEMQRRGVVEGHKEGQGPRREVESLKWWAETQAQRIREDEVFKGRILEAQYASVEEVGEWAVAWEELGREESGVHAVPCGCLLGTKGRE